MNLSGNMKTTPDLISYIGVEGYDDFDRVLGNAEKRGQAFSKVLSGSMALGAASFGAISLAAIKMESSFAGITKTTDGLRDDLGNLNQAGEELKQQFIDLSTRTPIDVHTLNEIGEAAGQLGVAKDDLVSFTETIAMLGETTNLSTDQAASELARFDNITKKIADQSLTMAERTKRVGSTIVALGNNFATTEAEIVGFSQRLSAAGVQIDMSQSDILAYSAALSSVGVNAEAGGTAFSKMFANINTAVMSGGPELEKYAEVAGMTGEAFANMFQENSAGAIQQLLKGFNDISESGGNVYEVLNDLEMKDVRMKDAVLRLSGAHELLGDALELSAGAYEENGALAAEAAQRYDTMESQMAMLGNTAVAAFTEMGDEVLPILKSIVSALNENPEAVMATVKAFSQLAMLGGVSAGAIKAAQALGGLSDTIAKAKKAWSAFSAISGGPVILALTAVAAAYVVIKNAMDAAHASRLAEIESISDNLDELEKLENSYNAVNNAVNAGTGSQDDLTAKISTLQEKYKELGYEVDITSENFGQQSLAIKELKIAELTKAIEEGEQKIADLAATTANAAAQSAALASQGNILTVIAGLFAKKSDNLTDVLEKQRQELAELTGDFENNAELQEALIDAGIRTTKSIQDEITYLEKLKDASSSDAAATEQLEKKIERLKKQLEEATDATNENADAHNAHATILEKLQEFGIKTTNQIKAEIAERKNLLSSLQKGTNEYKALQDQIENLQSELDKVKPITEAFKMDELERVSDLSIRSLSNLTDITKDLKVEQIDAVEATANYEQIQVNLKKEVEAMYGSWADYSYMLGSVIEKYNLFGDKSKAVAGGLNIVETALGQLASGGIDPVSLGFTAVTTIIDLFSNKSAPIVKHSIDEMTDSLGDAYDATLNLNDALKGLESSFESDILGDLRKQQETYADMIDQASQQMKGVPDIVKKKMQEIVDELKAGLDEVNAKIEAYTKAFEFKTDFGQQIDELGYLTDEYTEFLYLFGSDIDAGNITALINEQIESSQALLLTLDPTSEAYAQLEAEIQRARDALQGIFEDTESETESLEDQIDIIEEATNAWDDYFFTLNNQWNDFAQDSKYWNGVIDDLLYWNVDLDTTDADEALYEYLQEYAEYLKTLDPTSQAFADGMEMFQQLRQRWMDLVNPVEAAEYANDNFAESMDTGEKVANEYESALDDLEESATDLGSTLEDLGSVQNRIFNHGGSNDDFENTDDALQQILADLAILGSWEGPPVSKWAGNARVEISHLTQALSMLTPGTDAYNEALLRLMDAYRAAGIPQELWTHNLTEEQEALLRVQAAGYEIEEMVWNQIHSLEALLVGLDEGSYEYNQITDDLGALYDKLGVVNPYIDEQTDSIQRLSLAWGDSLDHMFGQYDAFMDAFSFRESGDGFDFTGDAFEALERLERFGQDLSGSDIERQLQQWVLQMQDFMGTLEPDSEAYVDAEFALNEFLNRFFAAGGTLENIEWSLPGIDEEVQDPFEEFYNNIENVSGDIENMLDYEVNLDTSDADEKIETMITGLQNYLSTLSPESPGYSEAKRALDALVAQYVMMYNILSNLNGIPDINRPVDFPKNHTGGFFDNPYSGNLSGLFANERVGVFKEDELILRSEATQKWGKSKLQEFNDSLDPKTLIDRVNQDGGSRYGGSTVKIYNAGPRTYAEETRNFIQPAIEKNDQYTSRNPLS